MDDDEDATRKAQRDAWCHCMKMEAQLDWEAVQFIKKETWDKVADWWKGLSPMVVAIVSAAFTRFGAKYLVQIWAKLGIVGSEGIAAATAELILAAAAGATLGPSILACANCAKYWPDPPLASD